MAIVNITGALNLNGMPIQATLAPCATANLPPSAPQGTRGMVTDSTVPLATGIGQIVTGNAFNPATVSQALLSNDGLTLTCAGNGIALSTVGFATGKHHFEISFLGGTVPGTMGVGFASSAFNADDWLGQDANSFAIRNYYPYLQAYSNGVSLFTAAVGSFASGDIVAVEVDFGAQLFWYQNVTSGPYVWNANILANPATGAGGISFSSMASGVVYYMVVNLQSQ